MLDLKWYEDFEKLKDFVVKADIKGWEVNISHQGELLTLKIRKKPREPIRIYYKGGYHIIG